MLPLSINPPAPLGEGAKNNHHVTFVVLPGLRTWHIHMMLALSTRQHIEPSGFPFTEHREIIALPPQRPLKFPALFSLKAATASLESSLPARSMVKSGSQKLMFAP